MDNQIRINPALAKQQNMSELEIACFELLSTRIESILKRPTMYANPEEIPAIIAGFEYVLQDLLHFGMDADKHKYWKSVAGCSCPYMDNDDLWGTGRRIIDKQCKWHGDKK